MKNILTTNIILICILALQIIQFKDRACANKPSEQVQPRRIIIPSQSMTPSQTKEIELPEEEIKKVKIEWIAPLPDSSAVQIGIYNGTDFTIKTIGIRTTLPSKKISKIYHISADIAPKTQGMQHVTTDIPKGLIQSSELTIEVADAPKATK